MSLRRNSVTPRSQAACRSNALKSTGPRSRRGKARVSLNARPCSGGVLTADAVLAALPGRIDRVAVLIGCPTLGTRSPSAVPHRAGSDRRPRETKLESPLLSGDNGLWGPTECRLNSRPFRIVRPPQTTSREEAEMTGFETQGDPGRLSFAITAFYPIPMCASKEPERVGA